MKKIIISFAAFAAISTSVMANDRTEEYNAAYRNVHFGSVHGTADQSGSLNAGGTTSQAAAAIPYTSSNTGTPGFDWSTERGDSGANR